jgi:hypothetical protein
MIDHEELPVKANLKVLHINDPDYGMTEDEIDDRNEFVRCYILKDFETILAIRVKYEREFFIDNWENSAFNTEDYYRLYPGAFNKYAYRKAA